MVNNSKEIYHEPHEQGANLESGEIYYKYALSKKREGSGVFVRKLSVELHDKITNKNPKNLALVSRYSK